MTEQMKMDGGKNDGPVECLGMTFPSEDARREHFLKLLAEKLQDPAFRAQEGFPKGTDDAILAISDPPYYTACPNPWLKEFVKLLGKSYSDKDDYSETSFALDVVEGKNDPLYAVPSYHTKVPPKAIENYIRHYTKPGDLVLDAFCGTGMTGVAAANCDRQSSRVRSYTKNSRNAILIDLSPAASFIASFMNSPLNEHLRSGARGQLASFIKKEILPLYRMQGGKADSAFDYSVFSDWGECEDCGNQFLLYGHIIDYDIPAMRSEYPCPGCGVTIKSRTAKRAFTAEYDSWIHEETRVARTSMVLMSKRVGQRAVRVTPTEEDIDFYKEISSRPVQLTPAALQYSHMTHERNNLPEYWGITHIHHFFTRRNYLALDKIAAIPDMQMRRAALLGFKFEARQLI